MISLLTDTQVSLAAVLVSVAALLTTTLITVFTTRANARRSDAQLLFAHRLEAYRRFLTAVDRFHDGMLKAIIMTARTGYDPALDIEPFDAVVDARAAGREIRLLSPGAGERADAWAQAMHEHRLLEKDEGYKDARDVTTFVRRITKEMVAIGSDVLVGNEPRLPRGPIAA